MPVYPYICDCGNETEVVSSFAELKDPTCDICYCKMFRNYAKQNIKFNLGMCCARYGYTKDVDDMEEAAKKNGEPVGYWVGNWAEKDPHNGRAKVNRSHREKPAKLFVPEKIEEEV